MAPSVEYQLLIPANSEYLFNFYLDCYHWNILFRGIEKSWLEQEATLGVNGRVVFSRAGSWQLNIISIYDDLAITIAIRRLLLRMEFIAEIDQVRQGHCRVTHKIKFPGIFGRVIHLLWGRQLRTWLQINLYELLEYAKKTK